MLKSPVSTSAGNKSASGQRFIVVACDHADALRGFDDQLEHAEQDFERVPVVVDEVAGHGYV